MFLKALGCVAIVAAGGLASLHLPGGGCPGARFLASASALVAADDASDAPSLAGVWVQNGGEMRIAFEGKDAMKLYPHGEGNLIVIVCEYSVDKQGQVKAKVTDLDGEAKDKVAGHVPIGLEFRFKWSAQGASGTLEDVQGEEVDPLKSHLEGKYDKKP